MTSALFHRIHRALVALVLLPVMLYRRYLSPLKRTPTCIYLPTCSQYAVDAVRTRGIVVGVALSAVRILRCNPLFHGGLDPVPSGRGARTPSARTCTHAGDHARAELPTYFDGACTAREPH